MKNKLNLSIIGLGKVGATLAIAAKKSQQYNVIVGVRDKAHVENIKPKAGIYKWLGEDAVVVDIPTAAGMGDIVLLTVADDSIELVCDQLSQAKAFKTNAVVAHCSGALSSDVLLKAKKSCGAHLASMHPLQTFPDVDSALKQLSTSYCYYEGEEESKAVIQSLINAVGMKAREIKKESKMIYHASAVVACNYFTALMDASLELGEEAGIDRSTLWSSLEPLVEATLENIKQSGTEKALTGPIARGDTETVDQHLQALSAISSKDVAQRLTNLYSAMGVQTLSLAKKKENLSSQAESELLKKLQPLIN